MTRKEGAPDLIRHLIDVPLAPQPELPEGGEDEGRKPLPCDLCGDETSCGWIVSIDGESKMLCHACYFDYEKNKKGKKKKKKKKKISRPPTSVGKADTGAKKE